MRTTSDIQSFLKKEANRMKKNPTPAEEEMKKCLENAKIRFQFQSIKFSKGTYRIFDFYIPKHRLVIEVDGEYHNPTYDEKRDKQVHQHHHSLTILRFSNKEVLQHSEMCLKQIQQNLYGFDTTL